MERNFHAESRFRYYSYVFYIGGVPLFNASVSGFYRVYVLLCYICSYSTVLAMFMGLYHYVDDVDHVTDVAVIFITFFAEACTQMYFRFRRAALVRMLKLTDVFIWEDLPCTDPDTGSLAMAAWIPRIKKVTTLFTTVVLTYHAIQILIYISTSDGHPTIYEAWYPFDTTKSPAYELANIAQVVASIPCSCFSFWTPGFYGTLVCIACSQLEKLRANLQDIRQKHDTSEQDPGAETDREERGHSQTSDEVFCRMQRQLNDCIRHHQQIIRFVGAIEEVFSPMFAGYFLTLMMGLCIASYSAVTRLQDLERVLRAAVVYVAFTTKVLVFCWLGSELSDQAERVKDAAWGCDWVGTPLPFTRCLSFVIKMASKEIKLTAGKFVPVSKATMMNMLQESTSLFMFMLQMQKEE